MPPESRRVNPKLRPAFRITGAEECEALFAGEHNIDPSQAWPVTAESWLNLHGGNLAAQTTPNANLPWWLSLQTHPSTEESTARALVFVPPQLACFAGHFPGQPLLPGVIQLQWAQTLAERLWPAIAVAQKFGGTSRLKFKAPILPGDFFAVQLRCSSPKLIQIELRSSSELLTTGRLSYRD